MGGDAHHVLERRIRMEEQGLMDVDGDFTQNLGAGGKREGVEHGGDGALERVLDGDDAVVGLAPLDRLEHLG